MSAPPLANSFNGGSDGTSITAANSGGTSGNAFDFVQGGGLVFTNAQSHSGGMAIRGVDLTGSNWVEWDSLGSLTGAVYFRWYLYISGTPATNAYYSIRLRSSTPADFGFLKVNTSTRYLETVAFDLGGMGDTGSVAVATGQWVRVEWRVVAGASGAGNSQWKLFNTADSTTPSDTNPGDGSGMWFAANCDQALFGMPSAVLPATPFTVYMDDIAVSTTDWIGPTQAGNVGPIAVLSGMGW